jgi:hypothetical protein
MAIRKPFDFPYIHVIYRAMPGGSLRPDILLIAEN